MDILGMLRNAINTITNPASRTPMYNRGQQNPQIQQMMATGYDQPPQASKSAGGKKVLGAATGPSTIFDQARGLMNVIPQAQAQTVPPNAQGYPFQVPDVYTIHDNPPAANPAPYDQTIQSNLYSAIGATPNETHFRNALPLQLLQRTTGDGSDLYQMGGKKDIMNAPYDQNWGNITHFLDRWVSQNYNISEKDARKALSDYNQQRYLGNASPYQNTLDQIKWDVYVAHMPQDKVLQKYSQYYGDAPSIVLYNAAMSQQ